MIFGSLERKTQAELCAVQFRGGKFPVYNFKEVFQDVDAIHGFKCDLNIFYLEYVYNSATQRQLK